MKFGRFYSHTLKATVKQINKTLARKLYDSGKSIYVHPCNMIFDSVWQSPYCINVKDNIWGAENFDGRINDYMYYNCDNECGKYPCFFIVEK